MADLTIRDKFFDDLAKGARWDVGVSIARGNPLPLDAYSVFESFEDLETYVAGVLAYPGQVVAVVNENSADIYYLDHELEIKPVGIIPVGDESTIVVAGDGTISLAGVEGLTFTETNDEGATVDVFYQALLTKDGLTWVKPDNTTVEGLQASLKGLQESVGALSGKIDGEISRATKAEEALSGRIDSEATARATEDAAIRKIAEDVRDAFNTFMSSEDIDDTVNTLKEIKNEIAKMTDATELATALAAKADKTEVETALSAKADKTEVETALNAKANTSYVNDTFATKEEVGNDLLDLETELQEYASEQANEALEQVAATYATTATVNGIDSRVQNLEKIDHTKYATKDELNSHAQTAEAIYAKKTDLPEGLAGFDSRITTAKNQADQAIKDAGAAATQAGLNKQDIANINVLINGSESENIAGLLKDVADLKLHDSTHSAEFTTLSEAVVKNAEDIAKKADGSVVTNLAGTVGGHTEAIAAINNPETGILAQANAAIAKKADATALNNYYTKTEVDGIEESLTQAINNAKYDDAKIKADIKSNTDALAILNGTVEEDGSVAKIAKDAAKAEVATVIGAAPEAMDTLEEVAAWIANDKSGAAAMAADIAANKTAIDAINNETTGILAQAKAYTDAIPTATAEKLGLVKYDNATIKMNESKQLYVAEVSTDLLVQGKKTIILNGGSANKEENN